MKDAHPHHADLIDAYHRRFAEMIPGPIAGTVELLAELRHCGTPLYALSNFSAETFPPLIERFAFLRWFHGIVISGVEGVIKPDPRIYRVLLDRFGIDPDDAIFIDDVPVNVEAASRLGIYGILFSTAAELRAELRGLRLLPEA